MTITSMLFTLLVVTAIVANGLANFWWNVRVITGKQESAGTDDRVYIRLLQGSKKSPFYRLNDQRDNFERGATDDFDLPLNDIGEPDKIVVYQHRRDWWFVSWIVLQRRNRRDNIYIYFPIHHWLVNAVPGTFSLLGPGQQLYCDWRVVTYTGKKRYSDTDDHAFISVYGNNEWTALYKLNSPKDDFEWSAKDEFSVRSKCFNPTRIKVLLRGNDGWFLSRIELQRKDDTKKVYIFPFHLMLDSYPTEYMNVLNPLGEPLCEWRVTVSTGNIKHAGTQGIVYMQIFGSGKKTGIYELPYWFHRYYKGKEDVFDLKTYCLIPTKIDVTLEENDKWYLNRIELQRKHNRNSKYVFPFYKWFDEGTTHTIEILDSTDKAYCDWNVEVLTSTIRHAHTKDDVLITIFGNETWTPSYKLSSPRNFERGTVDMFDLQSKCLIPTKIKVQLTGDDGWHLNKVRLTRRDNMDKGFIFLCDCWLGNNGEKILTVQP